MKYEKPTVEKFGTFRELTQNGACLSGFPDWFKQCGGSGLPPGVPGDTIGDADIRS